MKRIFAVACVGLVCLSAAAWVASYWNGIWRSSDGILAIGLVRGEVSLHTLGAYSVPGRLQWFGFNGLRTQWWPTHGLVWVPSGRHWIVAVPLWLPLALGAVGLSLTRLARRRPTGACRACGYDKTGLDGPCPECGLGDAAQTSS